ncbi:hypothetical protein [Streptomyces sp. NPDC087787]|uniref:hypothetical protein n=1 Tax=Streptomyces sp. NPDC087787 TaxID=3365803 RepID=UPI0038008D35
MSETRQQFWLRRGRELNQKRKSDLCALYRGMGGRGGVHPPEKWRKDEVLSSIVDMEWDRLPAGQKRPDPPFFQPPCAREGCGQHPDHHRHESDHHYFTVGATPDSEWVCPTCSGPRAGHCPHCCTPADDDGVQREHHVQCPQFGTGEEQPTQADATPAAHAAGPIIPPVLTPSMPLTMRREQDV